MQEVQKKKGKKGCLFVVLGIVGVIILLALFGGNGEKKQSSTTDNSKPQVEEKQEETEKPLVVSASKVASSFHANELKGKEEYTGKYAEITGTVESIGEVLGYKYVVLKGAEFVDVQCYFNDDNAKALTSLKKGQQVQILGTIGEMSINVEVKDCELKQ